MSYIYDFAIYMAWLIAMLALPQAAAAAKYYGF